MTANPPDDGARLHIIEDRFAGHIAVVTGGASGIGAAAAARLSAEGAHVVIMDLDHSRAESIASALPDASAVAVDVADPHSVDKAFERVVELHGRVDLLVHSAGVDDPESKAALRDAATTGELLDSFRHIKTETWRRLMSINLDGTFYVLRAAINVMQPRRRGTIVTIASSAAFDALEGYSPYATSKAGAKTLTQSVAKEAARHGIRVNSIAPGPVATPMSGRVPAEVQRQLDATGSRGPAPVDEIADSICFLASPGAANLVGAVLLSNAGRFTV